MNYEELINLIIEYNGGCITRQEALAKGIPSATFSRIIKKNNLQKVSTGKYANYNFLIDDLSIIQNQYSKIIYSNITSLYIHNLCERVPDKIEFSIPKGYRVRKDSIKKEYNYHIENNLSFFDFGNVKTKTQFGNEINCYSKEKTIIELIRKKR